MKNLLKLLLFSFVLIACNTDQSDLSGPYNFYETENNSTRSIKDFQITNSLEQGIANATLTNKPILLYFTGYGSVNSRKIEENLLVNNESIFTSMKEDFVNVWLYVDDKASDKDWGKYQIETYDSYEQPYFVILDSEGKPISNGMNYMTAWNELELALVKHK